MENYKGFTIQVDKMQGFSLMDRQGSWACSMTSKEKLKEIANNILNTEK